MSELAEERQQSARLCDEVGRLKTMVAALTKEAGHVGELYAEVNSELKQVKLVLAWASENVWMLQFNANKGIWQGTITNGGPFEGATLYEALHTAWENREKGEVERPLDQSRPRCKAEGA